MLTTEHFGIDRAVRSSGPARTPNKEERGSEQEPIHEPRGIKNATRREKRAGSEEEGEGGKPLLSLFRPMGLAPAILPRLLPGGTTHTDRTIPLVPS